MTSSASVAERIRTLREMNGWTQADLAAAAHVSQSLLSSIEKLRRDASDDTVRAIAEATETPLSFFAVVPPSMPADSLHFRKNKTAPIRLTNQVKAFFREAHRVTTTLLERVSYPIGELPIADATAKGKLREDGRLVRDFFLWQIKSPPESKGEWDIFKAVARIPAEDSVLPLANSECPLVKK